MLTLVAGPGVVWKPAFGSWGLLQPERINAYAQAVIRTLQADEHQRGCLMQERVMKGDLAYQSSVPKLKPVKRITFLKCERFDVMSVRRWREKLLVRGYPAPATLRAQRSFAGAERWLAWRSTAVGRMTSWAISA
ncbi:MAG: hypothetical protein ACLQU3_34310 [Limisphaerales bacterium]